MEIDLNRRKWLIRAGATLSFIPLVIISTNSKAVTNENLRLQFKYQNTPKEAMSCISCLEFIPGKSDKEVGGCKVIPGDDEISPSGYCIRWNTM